ncbi:hypothetical protein IMSAGC012_02030 [Lachnospiraceae bacterium]|nr:hypothetical protein IMSAGC012_02030 [Lachnospiraceae bacterium]
MLINRSTEFIIIDSGSNAFVNIGCAVLVAAVIIFTFFLCMSLLIILSNATASLKSGKLVKYFGMADCHVVTDIGDEAMKFMDGDGHEKVKKYLEDMEQTLAKKRYVRGMYDGILYFFDDKTQRI